MTSSESDLRRFEVVGTIGHNARSSTPGPRPPASPGRECASGGRALAMVVQRTGEPDLFDDADTAPEDDEVDGWAHRKRPITSTVRTFYFGDPIGDVWCVYYQRDEDWFVGGSRSGCLPR